MTILEALTLATKLLKESRKENSGEASLDAQVLLAHALDVPKSYLFAHGEEELSEKKKESYLALVERRGQNEPLAYLTGTREFFNLTFKVTPATLIPRPETEQLVLIAEQILPENHLFMDIGTGSGTIAVTLAARDPRGLVFASDISEEALNIAKENAIRHQAAERVHFHLGNLLEPIMKTHGEWFLQARPARAVMTANLPYLPETDWGMTPNEVKDFEPKTALVGGRDGLDLYGDLLAQLRLFRHLLPPDLALVMEIDPGQKYSLPRLVHQYFKGAAVDLYDDYRNLPRFVSALIPPLS